MRRILFILTVAIAGTTSGFGAFSRNDAGTSAAQFLKLGAGARAEGMGEAFAGAADDVTAVYWNPAGLARVQNRSFSVMHAVWFEDISYDWVGYACRAGNSGVFGLSGQYVSYGALQAYDDTGLEGGSFSPHDMALTVSYARKLRSCALGVNVKYISSQIKESASAVAGDIGVQYAPAGSRLSWGLAVQNMGTNIKMITAEDPLPVNIKVGGVYAIRPHWMLALDINAPEDNDMIVGAGTEYRHDIGRAMSAVGRIGYNTRSLDTGGLNGLSAGCGFTYQDYTIDYAFVPYGDLGATHRVSFGIKF